MKFELEISLGNAQMISRENVAGALERVATNLRSGNVPGIIMDDNGNTVGWYRVI